MMIFEFWEIGWQMWNQIFIVDYSVDVLDFIVYVFCQMDIAYPWGTVRVNFN